MIHKPVMTKEVLEILAPKPGDFMIDGTLGGGGHARLLLDALGPAGKLLVVDEDGQAIADFNKLNDQRVIAARDNFANLSKILESFNLGLADGLMLDLGLSSDEIESSGRGFTFQKDEPLLMTLRDESVPVKVLLRELKEEELADIIYEFGDERYSRRIAQEIKKTLKQKNIETTFDLRDAILRAVPKSYERGRINPATRAFLALRIYANHEFENLSSLLNILDKIVKPGGRVAVITFHSNEDRIVKNIFRDLSKAGRVSLINKKVITPDGNELAENPRARSAKLRAIAMRDLGSAASDKRTAMLLSAYESFGSVIKRF